MGVDMRGDPGGGAARGARSRAERRPSRITTSTCPFDLSQITFLATANNRDSIPPALCDRMEVIEVPRLHAQREARHRARVPGARSSSRRTGSPTSGSSSPTTASRRIVDHYTREAGVRGLEREIAAVCRARRGAARRGRGRARGGDRPSTSRRCSAPHKHRPELAERKLAPGVATGLAWTPARRRHPLHRGDARCPARATSCSPATCAT